MAKDLLHQIVKETLILDGWTITHDPYQMKEYDPQWEVDFGAEKIIAAERGADKIAVEAKSFFGDFLCPRVSWDFGAIP